MKKITGYLLIGALAIGLGACTKDVNQQISDVEKTTPTGSEFSKGLFTGYVYQAKLEAKEYDFRDAERWAEKASMASHNASVTPEDLAKWSLPAESVPDLTTARARLMAALAADAASKAPDPAARAQVNFDCWVQEQEENIQPNDIQACRSAFEAAMGEAEKAVMAEAPKAQDFVVYFDTDSAKLNQDASATVSMIIDAAKKLGAKKVTLAGHTDRAGPNPYNDALSQKRVDAVAAALMAAGLSSTTVDKMSFGENKPRVATPDGTRQPMNRRVEVRIQADIIAAAKNIDEVRIQ